MSRAPFAIGLKSEVSSPPSYHLLARAAKVGRRESESAAAKASNDRPAARVGTLVSFSVTVADRGKTVTHDTPDTTSGAGAAWLRVCDVAGLLGVSRNTVRRWSDDGGLRSYRSAGGHRRYVRDEIMATIAAREAGGPEATDGARLGPADADLVGGGKVQRERGRTLRCRSARQGRSQSTSPRAQEVAPTVRCEPEGPRVGSFERVVAMW
jgi:excisionase family DNA binding protein